MFKGYFKAYKINFGCWGEGKRSTNKIWIFGSSVRGRIRNKECEMLWIRGKTLKETYDDKKGMALN